MANKITGSAIAEQNFRNWLVVRNAYARQRHAAGEEKTPSGIALNTVDAVKGRAEYEELTRSLLAVANARHPEHAAKMAALQKAFAGASVDGVVGAANDLRSKINSIADNVIKMGASADNAAATALNAYFGNPGFDQFAAINLIADQLYEQLTFAESFTEEGDSIQLTPEIAASAKAISRFRLPRVEISGASKTRQGDLNPYSAERLYSNNTAQIALLSEFKNGHTEEQAFIIDEEQQQALLGYARSISPALAGWVLQNQLMRGVEQQIMQAYERIFVDGYGTASYTDGEGGNYGLISDAICLSLASAGAASPLLASASDWSSNPNKLVQRIANYNYKPAATSSPIPADASPIDVYKDILRLLNLIALTNVNTSGKVVLYVPTSLYAVLASYLTSGTFNLNLGEALSRALGGTIKNITVKASGLLNARTNSLGTAQVNHVVAVVHGAPVGRKGIVAPMATASPRFTTGLVSEQRSTFAASLTFGGPMILQRGQVFDLAFSVPA